MDIKEKINLLKQEKDAVILAHYYVDDNVQEIADYIGDSFYLSKIASTIQNKIIVYCGVSFMGESAVLLNPNKKVIMPDKNADCPMAHMVTKEQIDEVKQKYEDVAVVCYINSTAQIKSWSDVVVTSANAVKIVKNLPNKNILFIPDKNLGYYVSKQIPEKNIITLNGYCPIHQNISVEDIKELKTKYPSAKILVHPECDKSILALADCIGSTTKIIDYATNSENKDFIIATEIGVKYQLQKQNPNKNFYFPTHTPICDGMKLITLEKILNVLETEENQMSVSDDFSNKAKITLDRMIELSK